jgi:hypothetical protein
MRYRLLAALVVIGSAMLLIDLPPAEDSRSRNAAIGFAPPEVILDSWDYGARLHPHYADFDGDGRIDQLVGVQNRLLNFRNLGSNARPVYAEPSYFDEVEPSANLPSG